MKKIAYLIFLLFAFTSCEQDELIDASSYQEENITGISVKGNNSKVDVCHKGKIINVSINAVPAHQGHGDAIDLDGDGYFDFENDCSALDCDDLDPSVNPGATEVVYNGKDDDCNPLTPDDDIDGDGFGLEEDCDDEDPDVNPGVEEICDNGIDDDCDGEIDEGCAEPAVIGDFRDGGIVFWVDPSDNTHGLACDINDLGGAVWGCYQTLITGADGTAIGTGAQNTLDILAGCTEANIVAALCANSTNGGFNDWFMPSKDELNEMYLNKAAIEQAALANGGSIFNYNYYYSSTQTSADYVWGQVFTNGNRTPYFEKYWGSGVRAIRAF